MRQKGSRQNLGRPKKKGVGGSTGKKKKNLLQATVSCRKGKKSAQRRKKQTKGNRDNELKEQRTRRRQNTDSRNPPNFAQPKSRSPIQLAGGQGKDSHPPDKTQLLEAWKKERKEKEEQTRLETIELKQSAAQTQKDDCLPEEKKQTPAEEGKESNALPIGRGKKNRCFATKDQSRRERRKLAVGDRDSLQGEEKKGGI